MREARPMHSVIFEFELTLGPPNHFSNDLGITHYTAANNNKINNHNYV